RLAMVDAGRTGVAADRLIDPHRAGCDARICLADRRAAAGLQLSGLPALITRVLVLDRHRPLLLRVRSQSRLCRWILRVERANQESDNGRRGQDRDDSVAHDDGSLLRSPCGGIWVWSTA